MTPEELAAIQERAYAQAIRSIEDYYAQANRDRAALLAEVDRLREVGKKLADRANRLDRALDKLALRGEG